MTKSNSNQNIPSKQIPCPYCKQISTTLPNPYWPFCSSRCKSSDFGHWLREEYKVPQSQPSPESDILASEEETED